MPEVTLPGPEADKTQDFITTPAKLQAECGVDDLKMSEYGIMPSEFPAMAENARATMGGLFAADPVPVGNEDCIAIYQKSFR